jgi:hypothetical protein
MMMGFGFLMMLAVVVLPLVLVAALVVLMVKPLMDQRVQRSAAGPAHAAPKLEAQACSHCGAGLQPQWTHCPQCGATV